VRKKYAVFIKRIELTKRPGESDLTRGRKFGGGSRYLGEEKRKIKLSRLPATNENN